MFINFCKSEALNWLTILNLVLSSDPELNSSSPGYETVTVYVPTLRLSVNVTVAWPLTNLVFCWTLPTLTVTVFVKLNSEDTIIVTSLP